MTIWWCSTFTVDRFLVADALKFECVRVQAATAKQRKTIWKKLLGRRLLEQKEVNKIKWGRNKIDNCLKLMSSPLSNMCFLTLFFFYTQIIPERQISDQLKEALPAAAPESTDEIYLLHVCNTGIFINHFCFIKRHFM